MSTTDEPLTALDTRLDALSIALARTPDIDGLIQGLRGYQALLALVSLDNPGSVEALALAGIWEALADVATEVRTLRRMKEAG